MPLEILPCWRSSCRRCHKNSRVGVSPPPPWVPALGSAFSWKRLLTRLCVLVFKPVRDEVWLEAKGCAAFRALMWSFPCVNLRKKGEHFENFWTINIPSRAPWDCLALETSFHRSHTQSHCVSSTCAAPVSPSSWTYSGTGCIGNSSSRSPHACSHGTASTGHGCRSSRTWGLWWLFMALGCASVPGTWAFGHTMSLLEVPAEIIILIWS